MKEFEIVLLLSGAERDTQPNAPDDILNEIQHRPHLSGGQASWDEENPQAIRVSIRLEAPNDDFAERQMAEELLELSVACLSSSEVIRVDVVSVSNA